MIPHNLMKYLNSLEYLVKSVKISDSPKMDMERSVVKHVNSSVKSMEQVESLDMCGYGITIQR